MSHEINNFHEILVQESIKSVRQELEKAKSSGDWFLQAKKDFDLVAELTKVLEDGDDKQRTSILHELGSNIRLCENKVSISNAKSIDLIIEMLENAKLSNGSFEPENPLMITECNNVFNSVRSDLLADSS